MTNLEALKIQFPKLSEEELKNNLSFWKLDADSEFDASNRKFWWVVYNIIGSHLFGGVKRISEGGYTIEVDLGNYRLWYSRLASQWHFPPLSDFGEIVNETNKW